MREKLGTNKEGMEEEKVDLTDLEPDQVADVLSVLLHNMGLVVIEMTHGEGGSDQPKYKLENGVYPKMALNRVQRGIPTDGK